MAYEGISGLGIDFPVFGTGDGRVLVDAAMTRQLPNSVEVQAQIQNRVPTQPAILIIRRDRGRGPLFWVGLGAVAVGLFLFLKKK